MSKPLRYGPVHCGVTGKVLETYSELTAVNYYSKRAGKVVTKFLNLDNQAPEVKELTDTINNAIAQLYTLHNQSPEMIAFRSGVATDIAEDNAVEKANSVLEPAETF